jgi:hypothetical protein
MVIPGLVSVKGDLPFAIFHFGAQQNGKWKLAIGNWKLEIGKWQMKRALHPRHGAL